MLFDLTQDPYETEDIATDNAKVVARIAAIMNESHTPSPFRPLSEGTGAGKTKVIKRRKADKGRGTFEVHMHDRQSKD